MKKITPGNARAAQRIRESARKQSAGQRAATLKIAQHMENGKIESYTTDDGTVIRGD